MRKINNNNIKYTTKIILTHIFSSNSLENNKNEGLVLTLEGNLYYTFDTKDLFVKDIVVQGIVTSAGNFTIIPVDYVMFLQQSSKNYRLDKLFKIDTNSFRVTCRIHKSMKLLKKDYDYSYLLSFSISTALLEGSLT